MNRYQAIQISEIPDLIYEGYYWCSNAKKPEIIDGERIDRSKFTKLPFVIEANFFAPREEVSVQVKNIDGQYYVARIDLSNLNPDRFVRQEYKGHDLNGRDFVMVEAWEERVDELLEWMKTQQQSWTAFAGFSR